MIQTGSKYGSAREQAKAPGKALVTPGKLQALLQAAMQGKTKAAPQVFVPTLGNYDVQFEEWYWREIKEGGMLSEYLRRERHTSTRRMRAIKRRMMGIKPNAKSDIQLKAAVPAREFFRWRAEDKDFWADDANLKSWKRDNPDAAVFI